MASLSFKNVDELRVFDSVTAPIWVFDVQNHRIWWANESGIRFWRAGSLEELGARSYASDSANVIERLRVILETTENSGRFQDIWTLYPGGAPRTAVLSFQRALLEEGNVGLLIEVIREYDDILDGSVRIAESAQSTTSLITMMSLNGRVLVQNAAALQCYGPPMPDDVETLDIDLRYPDKEISAQILSSASENKVLRLETEVQTGSGHRTHYIWSKRARDPVTGDPVISITEEDISEISDLYHKEIKRSAELEDMVEAHTDRLRVTQERMQRGLQLAAIWDWDIETNKLFFSPNFVRLLEYDNDEFYNKLRDHGFEAFINPEDYADYPATLRAILANPEKPLSLELRFITKSGQNLWIQIEGICYCDENGVPIRTAGLLTNVTLKKQLEAKLIASQKLEAIGQLTGGIAHDFNNLLTVIQGNIQLLQEMGQADDDLTCEIVNAVQRGADLTRHLLAFAGKQSLDPAILDVAQLLTRMRDTLLRILSEAIETVIEIDDALWPVFADAAQTEAALLSLAFNARDVMPKGGTLKITTENLVVEHAQARQEIPLEPGEYVRISVTDSGPGMTTDVISKAFEPFFTTKDIGKGSGLGLSMVLGFSQQSAGTTQIRSDGENGATISIYLPRAQQAQITLQPALDTRPKIGNGERVHVLEDNHDVVSTVTRMGISLGYKVSSSTDMDDALHVAKTDPSIAVFLIDVILPGGRSGVDFASDLSKIHPQAKIVLMSGYPQDEFLRDITETLSFEFLPKPFSRLALSDVLARTLNNRHI